MLRYTLPALAVAAAIWAAPVAGSEDQRIHLSEPRAVAALDGADLNLVMSYLPHADGRLDVTAEFSRDGQPYRSVLLKMKDGDTVAFSMPDYGDAVYHFARKGGTVTARLQRN